MGSSMDDLRPFREHLEGTISRGRSMGDNGSAEEKSLSGDPWGQLGDDMLVYILARLPLSPLKACKQVCKRWQAVTNSPEFDILHKQLGEQQPRLVCYRTNHLVRSKSQAFAYDEESRTWVTLPPMQFPSHNHGSLAGASGLVYAIAGPGDNKLTYKLTRSPSSPSSFLETWCKTPVMGFARHAPVVSVALGTGRTGSGHKVVVAGGVPDYEPDHMAVEVFDSETGAWEVYDPLPDEFSGSSSRLWMSGVVCDNKLYMSLIHSWTIYVLDFSTRKWAPVRLQRPRGLIYHHIMAIGGTLVVAGLCEQSGGKAVNVWKLNSQTHSLIQVGSMSGEVFASLGFSLNFLVNENLLFVFRAYIKDGARVVGVVSLEDCTTEWRVLPSVSSLGYRFDTMVTFCTNINISP
ncbi:hypothetical protein M758_2G228500 [Ceratodon purpureus]|nr:hypothetical protein M758_2G228500 [Ceratodon purpureus]